MLHCHACEIEYTEETGCLCPVFRQLMRDGRYDAVPPWWIVNEWREPLYCGVCLSSYEYGTPCYCEDDSAAAAVAVRA
jgi:hypothetical protein